VCTDTSVHCELTVRERVARSRLDGAVGGLGRSAGDVVQPRVPLPRPGPTTCWESAS